MLIPPPLGLYIHFPWCIKKCPYCDFNSHNLNQKLPEGAYIQALIDDIQQDIPEIWGRTISSIFLGGGTPSLFSAESLRTLLSHIRALVPIAPDCEITMEVNPGTQEFDNLEQYRNAGINRLSFGIQSLNNTYLQSLGRIHNSQQAVSAVNKAQKAGFKRINLDMMFALPDQSIEAAKTDLNTLIQLNPEHISYYQLTIEPNTLFASQTPKHIPNDEKKYKMYKQGQSILGKADYQQYEVSAYTRHQGHCQHNLNYWSFGDYLGIGAGAHSKITYGHNQEIYRFIKQKHPKQYLKSASSKARIMSKKKLTEKDLLFEFMLNAVRLKKTISLKQFEQRTGINRTHLINALKKTKNTALLEITKNDIALTPEGFLLSDEILKTLID